MLRQVMAPKADSAQRLGSMSWGYPVSANLGFSSLSALLGTAGQANYVAANLMLNALALEQQSQGKSLSKSVRI